IFAVGTVVPRVRAGVGAVATQAIPERAYASRCLDALASGGSAEDALRTACAADPAASLRQVAVVSADGGVAVHTGTACVDHAGHASGDGFVVAANMAAGRAVWPAMAEAYGAATGPLPRRLLAGLKAAEAAGGDARGVMSAALLVHPPAVAHHRPVDLRVDRSDD